MELQIQDLVSAIKKEGIESAGKEAQAIIEKAEKKAAEIIAAAKAEAGKTIEDASKEIAVLKQSAHVSALQAKRDAMLSLKKEVQDEYGRLLEKKISKTLSSDKELAVLIKAAITGRDFSSFSVEVAKVTETLKSELAEELGKGFVLKPAPDIDCGFKVVFSDGSGYLDCSDEELSAVISRYIGEISV